MEAASADAVAAVWRLESGRLVGALARLLRDVGQAEEVAQEALLVALERWPAEGLPANPAAWLMTTAKHRALDRLRFEAMRHRQHEAIAQDLQAVQAEVVPDFVDGLDAARADDIGDDLLRLIFIACHPVLPAPAQVALTLKLLGGLSTAEIARAFLQTEATIAQRIVRAKRALAGQPFELPPPAQRRERLAAVLAVVYLVFNEGYAASSGDDQLRPALCDEALRLVRRLQHLLPDEAEVQGLAALLEIQASRFAARHDALGQPVLLMDQDRRRWDALLIQRGLRALARAKVLPGAASYTLQAALAAHHARAVRPEDTDWAAIVADYDRLLKLAPSPVVALNRAVAVSRASAPGMGPAAAQALLDELARDPALANYPWLPSAQADVLERLGRFDEARAAYTRAATLAGNAAQRALLLARAAALQNG